VLARRVLNGFSGCITLLHGGAMNRWHRLSRVVLTLIAAAIVASVTVSAAEAGQGRGRGYGNARYKRSYSRPVMTRRVVVSRPSYGGYMPRYAYAPRVYYRPAYGTYRVGRPTSGGYLAFGSGGFAFGFSLSNRPAGYSYMDPYCNTRFSSLAAYHDHCLSHRHEVVVRVIHENAQGRVYQDYDNGPREDWNGGAPHEDWNGGGQHEDWNDGDKDDRGDWNDGDDRGDWNEGDDDDGGWNDDGGR
jgi:hypothetical protein